MAVVFSGHKVKEVKDTNVVLEEQLQSGSTELDFSYLKSKSPLIFSKLLPNITSLNLEFAQFVEVIGLENLPNLKELFTQKSNISKLSGLNKLTKLEHFFLLEHIMKKSLIVNFSLS